MPKKYHIKTNPVPPRNPRIGRYGVVDWREDCARCHNCVKKACVYDRYRREAEYLRTLKRVDALFFECLGCYSCIQDCTKGLLRLSMNSEFEKLGNAYWTPDIIQTNRLQAETAKIPVSGAGYRGKFSGHGFDAMWTDMSEIVRPTRVGIHGREYISTAVDIGRKPPFLTFNGKALTRGLPPLITIPMPLIFDVSHTPYDFERFNHIITATAVNTDLIAMFKADDWPIGNVEIKDVSHIAFSVKPGAKMPCSDVLEKARLIEIHDCEDIIQRIKGIKEAYPGLVVSVRVELNAGGVERAVKLAGNRSVEVLHVVADINGDQISAKKPVFIKDMIRQIHTALIKKGNRDEITLMAGGGIALPEHVIKALLCGADLVSINLPLLLAIECNLCKSCEGDIDCPSNINEVEHEYGVGRMTNLIGAWHDQIIELMGAMGMRDARRLRGDVGRAMFFEDLEEETFGKLFNKRRDA